MSQQHLSALPVLAPATLQRIAVIFILVVLNDVATTSEEKKNGNSTHPHEENSDMIRLLKFPTNLGNSTGYGDASRLGDPAAMYRRIKRSTSSHNGGHKHKSGGDNEGNTCDHANNKQLCLPKSYSKFELPFTEEINIVEIGIDISDVLSIEDREYSVTFSCYFNVLWKEPRLHISNGFLKELNASTAADAGETLIPVNLELVNELWLPNIFIYNLKTFKVVEVLSKHAGLWVTTNHDVFYSQATHITFICPMRFDSFPLDTQRCKFQVGSYSFDDTKMIFLESPRVKGYVETSRSIVLDYDVAINPLSVEDRLLIFGSLGNYSVAGFEMVLHRYVSHHIITYYVPSGLFVVVSWISFVVPPDVIPGRMALLITLFLVLVNIFNNVTTNTPKAKGLTAIEAWMLACILFVFGALVEYAAILFRRQTTHFPVMTGGHPSDSSGGMISRSSERGMMMTQRHQDHHHHHHHHHHLPGHHGTGEGAVMQTTHHTHSGAVIHTTANNHYHLHHPPHSQPPHHLQQNHPGVHHHHTSHPGHLHGSPLHTATLLPPHHPHYPHQRLLQHHLTGSSLLGSGEELELDEKRRGVSPEASDSNGAPIPATSSVASSTTPTGGVACCPSVTCHRRVSSTLGGPEEDNEEINGANDVTNDPEVNDILFAANKSFEKEQGVLPMSEAESWVGENYIRVDRFFLIAMPLLFLVFNVVYWLSYASHFILQKTDQEDSSRK